MSLLDTIKSAILNNANSHKAEAYSDPDYLQGLNSVQRGLAKSTDNVVKQVVNSVTPTATNAVSVKSSAQQSNSAPVVYSSPVSNSLPTNANNSVINDSLDLARSIVKENNAIAQQNAQMQYEYNSAEAQKARDFQEFMSRNSHQMEVADLKAAGLNPVLSANNGATAYSASSSSGSQAAIDTSLNSVLGTLLSSLISSATSKDIANINAVTSMHNAEVSAQASRDSAYMMSEANRYGSQMSYKQAEMVAKNYLLQSGLSAGTSVFNQMVQSLSLLLVKGVI